jgi:ATP-binding cassette subfamily B protein
MMHGGGGGGFHMHGGSSGRSDAPTDEEVFGKVYNPRVFRRMVPFVAPYRKLMALSMVATLIFVGTQTVVPYLIKIGIDDYVSEGDFSGLTVIFAIFVGVAFLNWGTNYLGQLSIARVGLGVLYGVRREMFAHLQRLSLRFYDKTEVGRIMSRVQGDVNQLQEASHVVVMVLADMLGLVGIVVAMLIMDVKLALLSMSVIPILVLIMAVWQPFARKAFIKVRRAIAIVNGALNENITGVRVVQSMNRQDRNLEIFDAKNRDHLESSLVATRMSSGLLPPVDILTGVAMGLAIFFASRMIGGSDDLEIGMLIAFVMYIQRFFEPIRNLTMMYTQLQRSMASGVRIFDLLDADPDLVDAPNAKVLPTLRGEIEFKDVSFRYTSDEDVVKHVSLHINPGETVAIVGPTGAGKTTLTALMSRMYDVREGDGAILVDGHDIREVTRHSLASQMSMVIQEPFLFSGTVRENIKYVYHDVSDEQMVEAAEAVGVHDFIMRMENGYDTYLQERGLNLSVGQRQLISFARAIVADPRILILDEATANIDSYTEMLVQRALETLLEGRTAIVIAHRLSTIRDADRIVVLNLGEIVEVGTHQQLLANDNLYAHLYQMNYAAIEEPLAVAGDGDGDA